MARNGIIVLLILFLVGCGQTPLPGAPNEPPIVVHTFNPVGEYSGNVAASASVRLDAVISPRSKSNDPWPFMIESPDLAGKAFGECAEVAAVENGLYCYASDAGGLMTFDGILTGDTWSGDFWLMDMAGNYVEGTFTLTR